MKRNSKFPAFNRNVVVLILSLLSFTTTVSAETFSEDGYEVDVQFNYKKKDEKIKAWGTITGGEPCAKLTVSLLLTDGTQSVSLESSVKDYIPVAEGVELEPKSQQIQKTKGKAKSWRPYKVKIECL
jgi:hypothetical protein